MAATADLVFPALDQLLIEECMAAPSQTEALGVLRAHLDA